MGNQRRKRNLSIATQSRTANLPVSRYPFSSLQSLRSVHAPSTSKALSAAMLLCAAVTVLCAGSRRAPKIPSSRRTATSQEQRAIRAFNTAKQSPLQLAALLDRMPKGADLHMHLSGAIYAETFLKDAAADGLCVNLATLSFFKPKATTRSIPPQPVCGEGNVRADSAFKNQHLYDQLVDSFSMRSFVPSAGTSAHDQFFDTFDRFGSIDESHAGEWLDEVATRAAAQNEQYLEIMKTPTFSAAAKLGYSIGWPAALPMPRTVPATLLERPMQSSRIFASNFSLAAFATRLPSTARNSAMLSTLATGSSTAASPTPLRPAPSRSVSSARFSAPSRRSRSLPRRCSTLNSPAADPNVVGINFVQPEDAYMAMSEYHRQMLMLDYLHSVYPKVHISLHAGELAPGLVPPEGLRFHIREAVELGHAERIGHGVDIMYENDPHSLLKEMAARHIMVEINLTSNDVILGVDARHHPLPIYRAAGVPVALSTDDEGVSRITLTHEYTRAALDFNLTYLDLKNMARTSLEHSFLPGPSLWQKPDVFTRANSACAAQTWAASPRPNAEPSSSPAKRLRSNGSSNAAIEHLR